MASIYQESFTNLRKQIEDFERRISQRGSQMGKEEATTFLDSLTELYERLGEVESQYVKCQSKLPLVQPHTVRAPLHANNIYRVKVQDLKTKIARIISSKTNSTGPESSPGSDLQSRIKKQKFYIKQIEFLETSPVPCPVKAQVLSDQLTKLYEAFISNQAELELVADEATLASQQVIVSTTQSRVTWAQMKFKKIINNDVAPLLKKSDFLIHQIHSLESQSLPSCPAKAKVLYNHLVSLYDLFVTNQMKMETQIGLGNVQTHQETSRAQREITVQTQRNVIELQTNLMKIFEPNSTQFPSDFVRCPSTTTFSDNESNITRDTDEQFEIIRDFDSNERLDEKNPQCRFDYLKSVMSKARDQEEWAKSMMAENPNVASSSANFSQTAGNNSPPLEIPVHVQVQHTVATTELPSNAAPVPQGNVNDTNQLTSDDVVFDKDPATFPPEFLKVAHEFMPAIKQLPLILQQAITQYEERKPPQ